MGNKMRGLVAMGVIASALSVQSIAHAGVSNPDYYFIDVPLAGNDSIFHGGSGGGVVRLEAQLEGDIDSNGDWAFGAAAFVPQTSNVNPLGSGFVNVQPIVVASGTSGRVDPDGGLIVLTLRMRLKFTGGGVGTACQTALFTVELTTDKSFLSSTGSYNVGTGHFLAGAQDFTIPAMTGNCNTGHTALNTAFGLGAASGTVGMKFDHGSITNPQIPAP